MIFSILLFQNFYGQVVAKETKCPRIYKNKFTEILNEKYVSVNGKDTTKINEIRYEVKLFISALLQVTLILDDILTDKYGKFVLDKEYFIQVTEIIQY